MGKSDSLFCGQELVSYFRISKLHMTLSTRIYLQSFNTQK